MTKCSDTDNKQIIVFKRMGEKKVYLEKSGAKG